MAEGRSKKFLGQFSTPCLILPTSMGQLLYSPVDIKTYIDEPVLGLLDVFDLICKDFGSISQKDLCTLPTNITYIFSYRGSNGSPVSSDNSGVFVDAKAGRKHCSIDQYIGRVAIESPRAVVALADEIGVGETKKRCQRARERSSLWLRRTLSAVKERDSPSTSSSSPAVLAVHIASSGVSIPYEDKSIQGVVVGGLYLHPTPLSLAERLQHIAEVKGEVSSAKPDLPLLSLHSARGAGARALPPHSTEGTGALPEEKKLKFKKAAQNPKTVREEVQQNFTDILEDVVGGIDVVYSTYPLSLTQRGRAFTLSPQEDYQEQKRKKRARQGGEQEGQQERDENEKRKRRRGGEGEVLPSSEGGGVETGEEEEAKNESGEKKADDNECFTMNLWDSIYRKDTRPLVPGCLCHACRHHTRAYIHHLLLSSELLGEVLLYQHNQHHLLSSFSSMREKISSGGEEELKRWKESLLAPWQ